MLFDTNKELTVGKAHLLLKNEDSNIGLYQEGKCVFSVPQKLFKKASFFENNGVVIKCVTAQAGVYFYINDGAGGHIRSSTGGALNAIGIKDDDKAFRKCIAEIE